MPRPDWNNICIAHCEFWPPALPPRPPQSMSWRRFRPLIATGILVSFQNLRLHVGGVRVLRLRGVCLDFHTGYKDCNAQLAGTYRNSINLNIYHGSFQLLTWTIAPTTQVQCSESPIFITINPLIEWKGLLGVKSRSITRDGQINWKWK